MWGEFAVEVGGGDAAVHEEVAAGDERAIGTHEQGAERSDLVGGAGAPGRAQFDHVAVSLTVGAGQLVFHDGRQTLYVTEGRGLVQSRGEDVIELRPGDVHLTPDGDQHWHGAHHEHFMTRISITNGPATWGDHVTDAEYGQGT